MIGRDISGAANAGLREIGEGLYEARNMRHRRHAVRRPPIIELREGLPNVGMLGTIGAGGAIRWDMTETSYAVMNMNG